MTISQLVNSIRAAAQVEARVSVDCNGVTLPVGRGLKADLERVLVPGQKAQLTVFAHPEDSDPIVLYGPLVFVAPGDTADEPDDDRPETDVNAAMLAELNDLRRAVADLHERAAEERVRHANEHYQAMLAIQTAGHNHSLTYLQAALEGERARADKLLAEQAKSHRAALQELAEAVRSGAGAEGEPSPWAPLVEALSPLLPMVAARMAGGTGNGHEPAAALPMARPAVDTSDAA